jgi:uncharacterized protein (TIGR00156 family)
MLKILILLDTALSIKQSIFPRIPYLIPAGYINELCKESGMKRKMKKLICLAGLLSLAVLSACAQHGGFNGPGAVTITVAEARNLRDNTPVILQGKIQRFLGDEKYLFADDTRSIVVEIDNRVWGGLSVDQNDTVEIDGEIDRDHRRNEIEVNSIRKM